MPIIPQSEIMGTQVNSTQSGMVNAVELGAKLKKVNNIGSSIFCHIITIEYHFKLLDYIFPIIELSISP
jgi:hypothetical protein